MRHGFSVIAKTLSGARRLLLDALFPPRCPLCDAFVSAAGIPCAGCDASLHVLEGDAALAFDPERLSRARSRFAYEGRIRDALHGFKYRERLDLLRYLGNELSREAGAMGPFDLIVPVPMHSKRLRQRGFDQAALLAGRAGRAAGVRVDLDSLARARDIPPQVGLSREARIENVRGAFSVRGARLRRVEGRTILLIDDVMTTGATLHECAKALRAAGAASVCSLTVARAL